MYDNSLLIICVVGDLIIEFMYLYCLCYRMIMLTGYLMYISVCGGTHIL